MATAVKKATRKKQHREAISAYKKWLKENPKASARRQAQMFDTFIDSSELEEVISSVKSA